MFDHGRPEAVLDKSLIRNSFNKAASSYDHWAALQRRIGDRLVRFATPDHSATVTVLDLGSGTGYCSRQLNRPGIRVIDVDLAWAMLVKARLLRERETDYVCADAESLPISDRSIDLVFCNLVIQWCPNPERMFKEVHRILKPGGSFVFSTLGPETLGELREA